MQIKLKSTEEDQNYLMGLINERHGRAKTFKDIKVDPLVNVMIDFNRLMGALTKAGVKIIEENTE